MKRTLLLLTLMTLTFSMGAKAQLEEPNEAGVTMGQVSLLVTDVDANLKFWTLLGGTPMKIDGVDVMKFPSLFIFLVPGKPVPQGARLTKEFCACPADGYEMSTLNHMGFNVRDFPKFRADFTRIGAHMEDLHNAKERTLLFSPDGVMLEIAPSRNVMGKVGEMHFHTFVNDTPPINRDHQVVGWESFLWYHRIFGTALMRVQQGSGVGDDLPGVKLRISETRLPIVPTRGHAIDHIGFEVSHLEAFCKKLEADGIKFDEPYSTTRHKSFASAMMTDPWGTSIELTEGLYKF